MGVKESKKHMARALKFLDKIENSDMKAVCIGILGIAEEVIDLKIRVNKLERKGSDV